MAEIDERTLRKIADSVGTNSKLVDLGLELGFKKAKIDTFQATNYQGHRVTAEGTWAMLSAWHEKTPKSKQREMLYSALTAAKLLAIAEEYLGDLPASSGSSSGGAAVSPSDRVTEPQLIQLAGLIPPTEYVSFCSELGTDYNNSTGKLRKHLNDYSEALRDVLFEWKNRTGGSRNELNNALTKASIAGLIRRF